VLDLGVPRLEFFRADAGFLERLERTSAVFLADLSRALPILHTIDLVELAGYSDGRSGGVRLLKDLDVPIDGRDVLLVEDVVDTGLTLAFLTRTLATGVVGLTLANKMGLISASSLVLYWPLVLKRLQVCEMGGGVSDCVGARARKACPS
jgi:hypothetical protein